MADLLSFILQQLFAGAVISSEYALLAVGLALVFGILHIAHFAHGALYALGAYMTYALIVQFGLSYPTTLVLVVLMLAVVGPLVYLVGYKPLDDRHEATLIAALGMLIIIENLLHQVWGSDYLQVPYPLGQNYYQVGGVTMLNQNVLTIVGAALCIGTVFVLLSHTKVGKGIRAMSQNREAALYVGVSPTRVYAVTFALVTAIAGLSAVLIAPTQPLQPDMGFDPIVKAFIAVVLGGMGSLRGAVIASFILGLSEAVMIGFFAPAYADVTSFTLLVAILIVKPEGLFGGGQRA